jgi:hypothetical protein
MLADPKTAFRYDPEKDTVRKQYPQSGLYPRDRNDQPLWTVDWYASYVWPANDGVHLVRYHGWARASMTMRRDGPTPEECAALVESDAFSFYANGRLIRTVTGGELVTTPSACPASFSGIQWLRSVDLDDDAMTFTVVTNDGTRSVLDIRTGNVIAQDRPPNQFPRYVAKVAIALAPLLIAGLAVWFVRRQRARMKPLGNDEPGPNGTGSAAGGDSDSSPTSPGR